VGIRRGMVGGVRGRVGVVAAACCCGCLFGGAETGPCAHDSLACGDGPPFVIDETCEDRDALVARLGEGEQQFVALLPGNEPQRLRSPLGIEYLAFAVRIEDPDPDHPVFRVEIDLEVLDDDDLWTDVAERRAVYSGEVVRWQDDAVELLAIVVVPTSAWLEAEDRRINVDIEDTCSRRGGVVHTIVPESEDTDTDTETDTDTDTDTDTSGTSTITGTVSFE
jgi:hypothetical protein